MGPEAPRYVVYVNNKFNKSIVTFSTPAKQFYLRAYLLRKIADKHAATTLFLSTSKGIVDIAQASSLRTGGILIFGLF